MYFVHICYYLFINMYLLECVYVFRYLFILISFSLVSFGRATYPDIIIKVSPLPEGCLVEIALYR